MFYKLFIFVNYSSVDNTIEVWALKLRKKNCFSNFFYIILTFLKVYNLMNIMFLELLKLK